MDAAWATHAQVLKQATWAHQQATFHAAVVKQLEDKDIFSTYHCQYKQTQGKEEHPTFYMYRHKDKPYHIDYCFASNDMMQKLQSVEVGEYDLWTKHSNHVPLIVTFEQ